jgi:hypothetical protein
LPQPEQRRRPSAEIEDRIGHELTTGDEPQDGDAVQVGAFRQPSDACEYGEDRFARHGIYGSRVNFALRKRSVSRIFSYDATRRQGVRRGVFFAPKPL